MGDFVQTPIRSVYKDGSIVVSNVKSKIDNTTTSYSVVNTWHDGTPMDDSKVDQWGIYSKYKPTGEYLRENRPQWGELFLELDSIQQLRDITTYNQYLVRIGYYKGVTLNGYYAKNDTPRPIQYFISNTLLPDDGGSVFDIAGLKLVHNFIGELDVKYFGVVSDGVTDNYNIFTKISSYTNANYVDIVLSDTEKGTVINGSVNIYSNIRGIGKKKSKIINTLVFSRLLNLQASSLTISNLEIEFTNRIANSNAPIAIEFRGCNNTNIVGCKIINGRIACASQNNTITYGFRFNGNIINADLTPYDRVQVQNDVFYLIGLRDIIIDNNEIDCFNVNRVFKFADFEDNPNSLISDIIISRNRMKSITDSTKQFIDTYQHTHNFKLIDNYIETYGHNSVFENKTTMSHLYNSNIELTGNIYKGDGTFGRAYGVFASNLGRDNGGLNNIKVLGNTLEKTNNNQNLLNFMGFHNVDIEGNIIKGVDKESALYRIGNIKSLNISGNTLINGFGLIVADNTIDGATYTSQIEKFTFTKNNIEGNVGSASLGLLRISNHTGIKYVNVEDNFIFHKDIEEFDSRPLVLQGSVSIGTLVVKNNTFNGANAPLIGSANISDYRMYENSWSVYTYQQPSYMRSSFSESSNVTFVRPSQFLEVVGNTGNVVLTIMPSTNITIGSIKSFRNSSNYKVSLVPGEGVNIGGTLSLNSNTNSLQLMCIGVNSYRIINSTLLATTTVAGVVKQASMSPNIAADVGPVYSQSEVQNILTELRDLKNKLQQASIVSTI